MRSALADAPTHEAGHSRRWVVGLSSFLALIVAGTLWVLLSDEEYVAPPPGPAASDIRPAEAAALLKRLTDAVRGGDASAARELAAGGDEETGAALATLVRTARGIPVDDVDLRYVDELGGADEEGEWRAVASVTWRFRGFDVERSTSEVEIGFAPRGGDVVITDVGGPAGRLPIWMAPEVSVRRTGAALTLATSDVARYHRMTRRAVVVVRRVVPGWRSGLVVEVPDSAAGLDRALAAEPGTFANVAGVTASPDGDTDRGRSAHVFLNPDRMETLEPLGAQVVVSHEAAHVALGATESRLPVWLAEGMADYVALRDVPLPVTTTAAQVIRQVREEGPPRTLPGDAEFDDASQHFGAAYEAAWLACRLLADRVGERALLRFYRRADGVRDFPGLFAETFGLSLRAFTREWRQSLSDLAA
ncbi:hypothetical protein [Nocardioides coralli]|uniref:hypothetical protein n=1 Tax=Nocardioides coralli TaxID=2872154 RepID=UPI001CA438A9|nr:hypothetical protein [Nocardioides coralli]QZY28019.1 hypothetical protein K6T13_10985 [Nocardioides coralli]